MSKASLRGQQRRDTARGQTAGFEIPSRNSRRRQSPATCCISARHQERTARRLAGHAECTDQSDGDSSDEGHGGEEERSRGGTKNETSKGHAQLQTCGERPR
eukprot:6255130-Pyramimonas_sp.AAC.1